MVDTTQDIRKQAASVAEMDRRFTEIFSEAFYVGAKEGEYSNPGYQAYALMGVDVAVSICSMFLAIKNPQSGRTYRMACDLTYGLNTNEFWQKNASILLPTMHVALNSFRDGAMLALDNIGTGAYASNDSLILAARAAPLEIFPIIAYCIGGAPLMLASSITLKQSLSPYFLV